LEAVRKLAIEISSGGIPHLISIQKTEIFLGRENGLIRPRPLSVGLRVCVCE
jgi:hypothetical protein